MPLKLAAAYCRVSTDKEDQKNSLAAQEEYFRRHTRENGFELVHIYADEGITVTKKKNRREFLNMLEDAKTGKFDILFVKDVSRFARNTLDSLESVRMLKDHNVSIVFINNQGILETSSELMFTIMSAMAQEESVNTSKRVKFGKEQNAKKGKVPNLVYGYDKIPGDYFRLIINDEEAGTVRRIFRLYAEEGEGCLSIANHLNQEGIHTKRGCEWSQNAVSRILKNKIYIGQVINGKEETKEIYSSKRLKKSEEAWIVVSNEDLRIISDQLFHKADQTLKCRSLTFHAARERQSNRYLFSTLIKCRHCGRSFRRIQKSYTNTYVRWVCSNRNGNGTAACENAVKVDEALLLQEICGYLGKWLAGQSLDLEEVKKQYRLLSGELQSKAGDTKSQKAGLAKCRAKLKKFQDMYCNDLISMEELKLRSLPLKEKEMELAKLTSQGQNQEKEEEAEKKLDRWFQSAAQVLTASTVTNEMLKNVIERIEVDHSGSIEVILKKTS